MPAEWRFARVRGDASRLLLGRGHYAQCAWIHAIRQSTALESENPYLSVVF